MKALVTGGGGFLGLYIVEQLRARGDMVRVLCRGQYRRLFDLGVECIAGDLRDKTAVATACRGVDAVFHAAAISGVWGPWRRYYDVNTLGTLHLLEACRSQNVSRLIYTSSPSVVYDGQPHCGADESLPYPAHYLCHYPHSKALAEQAVLAANGNGLATVALRPHLIWGPRDNHLIPRLVARARSGRLRQVGAGDNLISMSYVENAAAAHLLAADRLSPGSNVAGQVYFINEPQPVNLWNWIGELLARAGLPPVSKAISAQAAWRVGGALERLYRVLCLPGEPPMTRFLASQLSSSHYYSVARAERDLSYCPQISLDEGMRRLEPELRTLAGT